MKRTSAAIFSTVFFIVAPGCVAGFAPFWISHWHFSAPVWDPLPLRWLGAALIVAGLIALVECFVRFVHKGHGTPAPPMPTDTLVVSGLYRYVRNPMYVGVFAIVAGQGLLFGDAGTLIYAACVWVAFTVFVIAYEEPTLRHTYGTQYFLYCAHVRRWWPRLRPWQG
ncbi:MAG TPA: isoprenylcysteine carboxylmethyltransferase family protein [Acidobacteriaceae bacterium]|jgi:protein-S-isoprenylcysteine O-methyltransferase Ste14|nr:isoprenylcysteine carboxylmethyltransferase family protein [Acidobacteriaceae bacterium]